MIALEEMKRRQDELQRQGQRLLKVFDLPADLSSLGNFALQGSFVYGLMVKPDIDGRVYCDEPSTAAVAELAARIMLRPNVVRTMVTNFLHYPAPKGMPRGIYFGVRVNFEETLWNFDIWVMNEREELGWEFFDLAQDNELKDVILLIKYQLQERGLYPGSSKVAGSFASVDVYRAVMNDGVRDLAGILEWSQTHDVYGEA